MFCSLVFFFSSGNKEVIKYEVKRCVVLKTYLFSIFPEERALCKEREAAAGEGAILRVFHHVLQI